jgi:hypothetical protein
LTFLDPDRDHKPSLDEATICGEAPDGRAPLGHKWETA